MELKRDKIEGLRTLVVEPNDKPDVAVVLMHGYGASGDDLAMLSREINHYAAACRDRIVFAFPAAPIPLDLEGIPGGRCWWPINMQKLMEMQATGDVEELASFIPEQLDNESARVERLVDALAQRYELDRRQVVVGGFSQGAMLATDVGLRLAANLEAGQRVGGLVAWSGTLMAEPRWARFAESSTHSLPVVQSHGRQDPILPFAAAENLHRFLTGAGHRVDFVPFDGMHQIIEGAIESASRLIENVAAIAADG